MWKTGVLALLVAGILAGVVPTWAARSARQAPSVGLTRWSGGSDPGLHVMPFPGTPDASPVAQVIFSALDPSELRSVSVVGSLSGRHAGRLVGLPDDSGTAFVPDHPFTGSERVRVQALLRSAADGTASGAPGSTRLSFSFGIKAPLPESAAAPAKPRTSVPAAKRAHRAGREPGRRARHNSASAHSARAYPPAQHFHTVPGLAPAIVQASRDPDHRSGDILLTPNNGHQNGPMILDSRGQLVWFDHVSQLSVYNLEVKTYRGQPVLTWWQGVFSGGHGIDGRGVIMNSSYHIVKEVRAGNGYTSDLHEFQVTPQGTAFIDCYVPVHADLTSRGGSSNGTVLDGVVQKIDIRTGRVLWEWHSFGHIPLSASYIGASGRGPYDYFHVNSAQELSTGKVLISARNTWGVYLIDERTGRVDWTLGGKHSDFRMGPGTQFAWQHDATLHRSGLLTLFDDAQVPQLEPESSAKELRIKAGRVSLVRRYYHSPRVSAGYEGSAQLLPNGNMFVGWGDTRDFSEHASGGQQIFNGSFLKGINSYRAYRFDWNGQPSTPPAIAVSRGSHGIRVYSSWNGATGVAHWRVEGGSARNRLKALGQAAARGFETGQRVHGSPRYLAVEALDAHGRVLGRSAVVTTPRSGTSS